MRRAGAAAAGHPQRKRKVHSKSRRGCGNCKLRRVKCDEAKPACSKCAQFGVVCNYGALSSAGSGELVLSIDGAAGMRLPLRAAVSAKDDALEMINTFLRASSHRSRTWMPAYQLGHHDLEVLDRFWSSTALTLGTDKTKSLFQKESCRLACMHPFLMHIMLGLTLMHDRFHSRRPELKPSARELFHVAQGIAIFNHRLSNSHSCTSLELDALWVASTFLGVATMGGVEARTPEDSWPLRLRRPSDPDWLAIGGGKKQIWELMNPSRLDSCFHEHSASVGDAFLTMTSGKGDLDNLSPELIRLLDLQDAVGRAANPRYPIADIMSRLMPVEYSQATVLKFITFTIQMTPEFHDLLNARDPGALALLAYWYAKVGKAQQWWTWHRANLECQAICIYLERHHGDIPMLERILEFPKKHCGLSSI